MMEVGDLLISKKHLKKHLPAGYCVDNDIERSIKLK